MTSVMEEEEATVNAIRDRRRRSNLKMPSVIKAERTENDISDGIRSSN